MRGQLDLFVGEPGLWGTGLLERTRLRRVARIVAASLLAAGVVVEAVSIGLFFLPAAIAMIVASVPKDPGDVRKAALSSPAPDSHGARP